jgi:hypothetical protein
MGARPLRLNFGNEPVPAEPFGGWLSMTCPSKFDPRAEAGFPRDERETRLRADRAQTKKDEILMRFNFDRTMR